MPVGALYELDFQYAIASRELMCTFGYRMSAGADSPEVCEHLAERFQAVHLAAIQSIMATDVQLQCVVARAVLKDTAIPGVWNFPSGTIGVGSGNALPAVSALVLKFLTTNINPKHNGRKFFSGCPDGQLLAGMFAAGFMNPTVSTLTTLLALPFTVLIGGDETFDPVVVNRMNLGVPIVPPTHSDVDSVVGLPTVYQQLGRKTKRTQTGP